MHYRKANSSDIPILTELRIEFLTEANGRRCDREATLRTSIPAYLSTHLSDGSFIAWLCMNDDAIIATSGISFYALPPSYTNQNGSIGYIMNMYTKKPFRRKGIASALFEKMLEEGRAAGVGKFVLNASDDGRSLYEKYGFTPTGDEMILSVCGKGQF